MNLQLSFTRKVTLAIMLLSIGALVIVGIVSYQSGRQSLIHSATSELLSSAIYKESQIDRLIKWQVGDIEVFARSPELIDAMSRLQSAPPQSATAQLAKFWWQPTLR